MRVLDSRFVRVVLLWLTSKLLYLPSSEEDVPGDYETSTARDNMTPDKLAVIRQCSVALSGSLSYATVGTAFAWPSPSLPKLLSGGAPLHLDVNEASWVVSVYFLGNLISPIPSGYLADKFGRQKTLLWCGLLPIFSWILVLLSTDAVGLYVARFLIGLHLGAVSTVIPLYVGEVSQASIRGSLNALKCFACNLGMLYVFSIGPFVSYRSLTYSCLVVPLTFFVSFFFAPETPHFLMRKHEVVKAKSALLWLRGDPNDFKVDFELDQVGKAVEYQKCDRGSVREIFLSGTSRKCLIIGIAYSAAKRLSGDEMIKAYATVTLMEKSFGSLTPNECVLILGIVATCTSFFATYVSDCFGRKTLAVFSIFGCSVSTLGVSIWFYLHSKTNVDTLTISYVPFLGFLIHTFSYNIGCASIIIQIKSEFFPTHLKTKLSAVCSIVSAVTSFLLNHFYLPVAEWEGMYLNFLIYAVSCFSVVLFIVKYVPETKGKSLQEIQDLLNKTDTNP